METITTIQQVPANLGAADSKGVTVPLPAFTAPPTWTVDNSAILTVTPAADGLSATCVAAGTPGLATITVSGTPVGSTTPLTGTAQVQVNDVATALTISFGTATQQTPPTPPAPPVP